MTQEQLKLKHSELQVRKLPVNEASSYIVSLYLTPLIVKFKDEEQKHTFMMERFTEDEYMISKHVFSEVKALLDSNINFYEARAIVDNSINSDLVLKYDENVIEQIANYLNLILANKDV